ncbi:MAG: hypothetical protein L0H79_07005 [Intrasporangium sp.]|uniref:hypothetical protein n=1 Tax=Intrasporangium sp. TaxID=1925024 RepID=UPI00264A0E3C|nr:hypothetical protein [Intrasporangium sp.]MDN5795487.1 hypothetical protein [Intrasporangium sp.]
MNSTIRRTVALVGALAITGAAAACSASDAATTRAKPSATSSPSPAPTTVGTPGAAEILREVKAHVVAATSAAFEGELQQGGGTIRISLKGTVDGKTSDVHLESPSLGKVHIIVIGKDAYVQADEAFWKKQATPETGKRAGGKFVKTQVGDSALTKDLTLGSFLRKILGSLGAGGLDGRVRSETVDGVDCWMLTDKAGKLNGALYAAKDSMQLVRFTGSTESPSQLTFSQWNHDLAITAPPADQVVQPSPGPTEQPQPTSPSEQPS